MKRFYRTVAVAETPDGFGILLDDRRLKTPAKHLLAVPSRPLAEALAAEWQAQDDQIRPDTMRLTKLASTALDRVAAARDGVIDTTLTYAGTDLLCYRAELPVDLVERETRVWQPLLDWACLALDAPLRVATGIVPVAQPSDSLKALRAALATLDPLALTAVADLTASLGSLILALALHAGRITAAEAYAAALLDETFQMERWGEDYEALDRRRELEADIHAAARFLGLLRG